MLEIITSPHILGGPGIGPLTHAKPGDQKLAVGTSSSALVLFLAQGLDQLSRPSRKRTDVAMKHGVSNKKRLSGKIPLFDPIRLSYMFSEWDSKCRLVHHLVAKK